MRWDAVADAVTAGALLLGTALTLIAAIGTLRFVDVLSRMHAATKPQTLGMLLILVTLAVRLSEPHVVGMLVIVALFQLLTAPVASHMVARAAYKNRYFSDSLLVNDELASSAPDDEETDDQDDR